jgi:hypothetical protein
MMREPPCEPEQCPEWVISGLKHEDLSQSASHPLADSHVLHEHVFSRFLSSA